MIECAQCGKCCQEIYSSASPEDLKNAVQREGTIPVSECWEFIDKGQESETRKGLYHYRCRYLKDNKCMIHDKNPDVCAGYPFYGKLEINKENLLSKDCIYYD